MSYKGSWGLSTGAGRNFDKILSPKYLGMNEILERTSDKIELRSFIKIRQYHW